MSGVVRVRVRSRCVYPNLFSIYKIMLLNFRNTLNLSFLDFQIENLSTNRHAKIKCNKQRNMMSGQFEIITKTNKHTNIQTSGNLCY